MHLLFYGEDGAAAKVRASELAAEGRKVRVAHAVACREIEPVDGIDFMPDVTAFERDRLVNLFGAEPTEPKVAEVTTLDALPDDWRSRSAKEIKAIANAMCGRMPSNKEEAAQMIEAKISEADKARQEATAIAAGITAADVPLPPPV